MDSDEAPDTGTEQSFWPTERVFRIHARIYGGVVLLWAIAVIFISGDWSLFWPVMIWTILFGVHFLVYRAYNIDPEWVDERVLRITEESKDLSHIEDIRDDYTGLARQRRPAKEPEAAKETRD